jgi:hypothetical protein
MPPFSDGGEKRRTGWEQLGLRWLIDWQNTYETTKVAESFCASLQIFLAHLAHVELSLLPADVCLTIELGEGRFAIDTIPDNEKVRLRIRLQGTSAGSTGLSDHTAMIHAVGASVLKIVSAMPREKFLKTYEDELREGLGPKLAPYAPYDRLFGEFYGRVSFDELHAKVGTQTPYVELIAVKTRADLSGPLRAASAIQQGGVRACDT